MLSGIGMVLGLGAVGAAALFGEEILMLLYGAEYARQDLFVWLMVAATIFYMASFFGHGMTAARYFQVQFPLFVVVTVTTVLSCFWLIPMHGLYGAATALIIASCVQIIGSLIIVLYAVSNIRSPR
jgi:O-antigen/teichoic acid export membrane protein